MVVIELHAEHGVGQRLDDDAFHFNGVFLGRHMGQAYMSGLTPVMLRARSGRMHTMKCILQRVQRSAVRVDGSVVGEIGAGYLILLGIAPTDTVETVQWMVEKIVRLRVFNDDDGRMNRSLLDVGGSALVVSQFTLFADARKGTRPSFVGAAPPEVAEPLYERFCELMRGVGVPDVARGVFGAHMDVELVNDGPVTITLER